MKNLLLEPEHIGSPVNFAVHHSDIEEAESAESQIAEIAEEQRRAEKTL
jgi:hypothetical protein